MALYLRDEKQRNPMLMIGNPAPVHELVVEGITAKDVQSAKKRRKGQRLPQWAKSRTRTPRRDASAKRSVASAERRFLGDPSENNRRKLADKVAWAEVYFKRPAMKGAYEKKKWYRPKLPSGHKYRVPRYQKDCRVIRELSEQAGCRELTMLPFEAPPVDKLEPTVFKAPKVPKAKTTKPRKRTRRKKSQDGDAAIIAALQATAKELAGVS